MSQLQVLTNNFGNFRLNVLAFSSPIFGSIGGAQTKRNMQWYPIKANQPEIQFDVQFVGEKDYEDFQSLVRNSQKWALNARQPMVHLNWPERNINNWSGLINEFQAGGTRFNPAPRARFTVFLFDSYISRYTSIASVSTLFQDSFPFIAKAFTNLIDANPYGLQLPSFNSQNQNQNNNPNALPPNSVTPSMLNRTDGQTR